MAHEKILYERKRVFIKGQSPKPETQATSDEISGTVTILENEHGKFFRFIPTSLEDATTDDWALIHGNHSIISYKNQGSDKDSVTLLSNPLLKFRYYFNLNDLQSIRRYHMLHGIAHIILMLRNGTILPAFHFNLGGSKELLQLLNKYFKLEK